MSLGAAEDESPPQIHLPAEIDWHMLDKSKFFFLGAALFSGVSAALYPVVVLKTRQQVSQSQTPALKLSFSIMRNEGIRGFYRGFGTSLMGTIPARALYMTALEITKSNVGTTAVRLGFSDTTSTAIANAAAGLSSAMAAQLVWTPVDVISQRLMVRGCNHRNGPDYRNGFDAFRKILYGDGPRGLYRGFGISILSYAPSNAVWWASYSVANRVVSESCGRGDLKGGVVVQGACAGLASGVSAVITMPVDTVKTRMQVLDGVRQPLTVLETVRSLVKEGGFGACYRGLGPRWVSMSMSSTAMITTYEFLKRLSTKSDVCFNT